jgi:hypothetical protein
MANAEYVFVSNVKDLDENGEEVYYEAGSTVEGHDVERMKHWWDNGVITVKGSKDDPGTWEPEVPQTKNPFEAGMMTSAAEVSEDRPGGPIDLSGPEEQTPQNQQGGPQSEPPKKTETQTATKKSESSKG